MNKVYVVVAAEDSITVYSAYNASMSMSGGYRGLDRTEFCIETTGTIKTFERNKYIPVTEEEIADIIRKECKE